MSGIPVETPARDFAQVEKELVFLLGSAWDDDDLQKRPLAGGQPVEYAANAGAEDAVLHDPIGEWNRPGRSDSASEGK